MGRVRRELDIIRTKRRTEDGDSEDGETETKGRGGRGCVAELQKGQGTGRSQLGCVGTTF
jgi:hypothetical protein